MKHYLLPELYFYTTKKMLLDDKIANNLLLLNTQPRSEVDEEDMDYDISEQEQMGMFFKGSYSIGGAGAPSECVQSNLKKHFWFNPKC